MLDVVRFEHPDLAAIPFELFDNIKPEFNSRWLVRELFGAGSTGVVFGSPGCGKSFLSLDIGLHIATGRTWFGRRTEPGGVVYIAGEGQAGLRLRVEAWRRTYRPAVGVPFALIPAAVDLLDPTADLANLSEVLANLARRWEGISLLVVDTLASTFGGGDENGPDMAAYVGNISRICAPHGCMRLIVHHSPVSSEAKRPRGHGSLLGAADTVLHVTGDRDAAVRKLHVLKQKDSDPGNDIYFNLRSLEIGTDHEGTPVTSCILEAAEGKGGTEGERGRRLSDKQRIVLNSLERTLVESGFPPPKEIPGSICDRKQIKKVANLSMWRAAATSALHTPDTKPDTARKAFDRAREALQAAGNCQIWEDFAWLK